MNYENGSVSLVKIDHENFSLCDSLESILLHLDELVWLLTILEKGITFGTIYSYRYLGLDLFLDFTGDVKNVFLYRRDKSFPKIKDPCLLFYTGEGESHYGDHEFAQENEVEVLQQLIGNKLYTYYPPSEKDDDSLDNHKYLIEVNEGSSSNWRLTDSISPSGLMLHFISLGRLLSFINDIYPDGYLCQGQLYSATGETVIVSTTRDGKLEIQTVGDYPTTLTFYPETVSNKVVINEVERLKRELEKIIKKGLLKS